MNPLSPQVYHLNNLSPQSIEKKSPPMNPYTSKTLKSLKGNCKENNLLDKVISWFSDQKSVAIGLFNQNNKLLINKELWTKCLFISSIRIMDVWENLFPYVRTFLYIVWNSVVIAEGMLKQYACLFVRLSWDSNKKCWNIIHLLSLWYHYKA